jgi:hypothetical protein
MVIDMKELKKQRIIAKYKEFYGMYYEALERQNVREQVNEKNVGRVANVQSHKETEMKTCTLFIASR